MKKSEYYKMFEELNEVKNQNKELIKFLVTNYKTDKKYNSIDENSIAIQKLLEQIKQKPIEEILREYE